MSSVISFYTIVKNNHFSQPTPEERGKIRALAAQKQTAKVCMKHFRKEEEEEEKKKEDGDEKEEDVS